MLIKADVLWISVSSLRLKTHLTSHPPQDVLSPEEYSKVRTEYKQSQIQAKKERSDITADEEERPPGEEESADDGKDSVTLTHFPSMLEGFLLMWDCRDYCFNL